MTRKRKHVPQRGLFAALNEAMGRPWPVRGIAPTDPNVAAADVPRLTGQNLAVLRVLLTGLTVTPDWGRGCGVNRLAARIGDLRKLGIEVQSEIDPRSREARYWIAAANLPAARAMLEGKA